MSYFIEISEKYKRRLFGFGIVERVAADCADFETGSPVSAMHASLISSQSSMILSEVDISVHIIKGILYPFLNAHQASAILLVDLTGIMLSVC